ncbi:MULTISPECIES: nitrogenase component 1 [Caproicibacterium]|jgi:hypothetical protein|uniref:Nitrogenase molybdenum-iron protein n=1 Tax=Caproicibacterium lactatifermentans TaxID=2666138 RepID=A0A859DUB1_9FIRM|nr:nitrogenase component 1 [Caproicibacterium lactatifermentans]ARP49758.1 nitrogenase molybdenum-iron protein [Ruminococcaceae bacterium CPB6]MDD4807935.1 nitrogenase component 1 [Oscillospiraceae bacterium]QKN24512.1 nitrogenase molybdenum-iron protein [Caproicibacterium lactatifermentans]QKO30474.1 nitrogenase molybdenum-iron protein [Caproicibacterium lactatifermentans]
MKGLLKVLSPFAPDQSGAVAALYELGGLIVICDAGGCTGNICGFDEPRWFQKKSAVFSAGLRDMDAILGRDDKLIAKLSAVAADMQAHFAAVIGTPVPAVIGTDFRALKRMGERQTGLPVLTVETTGTGLYDTGEEAALLQLFQTFAVSAFPVEKGMLGVLGATPLDLSSLSAAEQLMDACRQKDWQKVHCYGMGSGFDAVCHASAVERNLVVSPAGRKAAQYLQKTFGTPYTVCCPLPCTHPENLSSLHGKRVLIIHQQVLANTLRDNIRKATDADVTAASWFMMDDSLREKQDLFFTDEQQFQETVMQGGYDVIFGDRVLRRALPAYTGSWIDLPHFAVSGRLIT